MARPRKPVDLLEYEGKSHRTKKELDQRRKTELKVDLTDVKPPGYLTAAQKREFNEIADKLLSLDIFTELDEDTLARYLIAKSQYLKLNKMLNKLMKNDTFFEKLDEATKVSMMQDKAFKQCRNCAGDLGLTITSRCKLVIPKVEEPKENKFLARFGNN